MVRFCGSQDFAWTYHGRVVPYTENFDYGAKPHRKAKAADAAFKKGEREREGRREGEGERERERDHCECLWRSEIATL